MRFCKLILSISLLFSTSMLVGQVQFSKAIDLYGRSNIGVSLLENNDGYLLCALGVHPDYTYQVMSLIQYDSSGDTIWTKLFATDSLEHYLGYQETLSRLSDTSIFIAGTLFNPTTFNNEAIGLALYPTGDTLWVHETSAPGLDSYLGAKPIGDSVVYLIGWSEMGSPSNDEDVLVTKLTASGTLRWEKYYGTDERDVVADMAFIKGSAYLCGASNGFGDGSLNPYILKIRMNGDFIWHKSFLSNGGDNVASCIEASYDGNLVFAADKDTLINPEDYFKTSYLAKMDTNGGLIWRTYLPDSLSSSINSIKILEDGSIIFCGNHSVPGIPLPIGWLGKLNKDGELLWQRTYNHSDIGFETFIDIELTTDNYILLAGHSYDTAISNQLVWLVKLDTMGCLEPGCDTLTGIIDISPPQEQVAVKVFPNPASEQATIVLEGSMAYAGEELEVYVWSLSGQLVQKKSFLINGALPMLKLERTIETSGIYLIDVVHKGKLVGSGQLLWE